MRYVVYARQVNGPELEHVYLNTRDEALSAAKVMALNLAQKTANDNGYNTGHYLINFQDNAIYVICTDVHKSYALTVSESV